MDNLGFNPAKVIKKISGSRYFLVILIPIIIGGLGIYRLYNKPANLEIIALKNSTSVKLLVDKEGLYGFTLREAFGSVGDQIDPSTVQLTHKGIPVPLWISTNESNHQLFRFWGTAPDNLYTRESIYQLNIVDDLQASIIHTSPESAITTDRSTNGTIQSTFLSRINLEENEIYSPHAPLDDPWFWKLIGAPGRTEFSVEIPGMIPGQAYLSLNLWSNTSSPINPDHHIMITINEMVICEDYWDGAGTHQTNCEVPTENLHSGNNLMSVLLPGNKEVPAETIYINNFQLDYPKMLAMDDSELLFVAQEDLISISNINGSVDIFDITGSEQPQWISTGHPEGSVIHTISGRRYIVVQSNHYQQVTIEPVIIEPNISNGAGADYVVIGDEELIKAALPLINFRADQGIKTLSVLVNAIYDQFGYGYPDPNAIQMFIKHTQTWDIKPRYILLLGDASYDTRGYITSPDKNRLPTFFTNTEYGGYTATDIPFVDINNDLLPDIAIGRLPATSPEQITSAINKIITYETASTTNQWDSHILLIADGQELGFLLDAKAFQTNIPTTYSVDLFSATAGTTNNTSIITEKINSGLGFVVYFGHGSIQMWGKDQLLSVRDVEFLNNKTKLPIIINMTCLTGLFTHPTIESLSEALLWRESGGAVAILAPTSLTLPSDQSFLSNALANYIFINKTERLGDAVLASWRSIPVGQGRDEVLNTFLLLGDPALIIQRSSNTSK